MTVRIVLFLASVLLVISVAAVLLAAEWYVAPPPLGNNRNPGTKEEPFGTIQQGTDSATEGDTVIVAEAIYVEEVQFKGTNISQMCENLTSSGSILTLRPAIAEDGWLTLAPSRSFIFSRLTDKVSTRRRKA